MSVSPTPSLSTEHLALYQNILSRQLMREFNFIGDIASGRANARTDLTDKIINLLGTTASSVVSVASGTLSPAVQVAISILSSVAISGAQSAISNKRKEEGQNHITLCYDSMVKAKLNLVVEKLAKEATRRYEPTLLRLKKEEIGTFARVGIYRMCEYIGRTKSPLTAENLLIGLIEGKSGKGIEGMRNNHIKCQNGDDLTAEGAYARAAFCTSDNQVWIAPERAHENFGYTHLKKKTEQPKYYTRVQKMVVDKYRAAQANTHTVMPPLARRICSVQEVSNYLESFKSQPESFNSYIKRNFGAEIAVCQGEDLSQLDLSGKDFSGSELCDCIISGSLKGSMFHDSDLSGVTFKNITSTERAEFYHADLTEAHLRGNFRGTNFNHSNLSFAICEGDFTFIQQISTKWVGANVEKMMVDNLDQLLKLQKLQFEDQITAGILEQHKKIMQLKAEMSSSNSSSQLPEVLSELGKRVLEVESLLEGCQKKILSLNDVTAPLKNLKEIEQDIQGFSTHILQKIEKLGQRGNCSKEEIEELKKEIALDKPKQSLEKLGEELIYRQIKDKDISLKELKKIPIEKFIKAIEQEPNNSVIYTNLARALHVQKIEDVVLPSKEKMTPKMLLLRALSLNPNDTYALNNLGIDIKKGGTITLPDGKIMNQQDIFLKVISLDPNFTQAYVNLGYFMSAKESIKLPDGNTLNQRDLYLKAISLDPYYALVYHNLGTTLSKGQSVTLLDGVTTMTQQQLFLKTISLDPYYAKAYGSLASSLSKGERITMLDGTTMTQEELYSKAKALKLLNIDDLKSKIDDFNSTTDNLNSRVNDLMDKLNKSQ